MKLSAAYKGVVLIRDRSFIDTTSPHFQHFSLTRDGERKKEDTSLVFSNSSSPEGFSLRLFSTVPNFFEALK